MRPQTILVVDDEAEIVASLKQLFEAMLSNVRVITAGGGREGLAALKDSSIDLIITDYKMPGMNGLEFLAQAIKVAPQTPKVLITAFPDLEIAIRAVNEAKIVNFFVKPMEPRNMVDVIRGILADQRARQTRDRSFATSLEQMRRELEKK